MHKIIYLDTNIFLHYQPFTQINWLEIVKAESATIVIPPITIRELNKHKDSHPRAQIKKRAGETIKRLFGLYDLGANAKINDGVFVSFEDRDPTIDFAAHQLNFSIQDDQLIASILLNRQEAPTDHIVLVTSDLGLALVTKAGRQGINTQKLPENLRIADEPDPNESKVKQLEQQIRELNSRTPNLSLAYKDGTQHATIKLPHPVSLGQSEIAEKTIEIKNKFPKKKNEGVQDNAPLPQEEIEKASMIEAVSKLNFISQEEVGRYNTKVDEYITAYSQFMISNVEFENLKRRTFKLDIALVNGGTAPAEDIDIHLHFPNGFQLLEEDELPDPPNPPDPPVEPMTVMQQLTNSLKYPNIMPSSIYFDQPVFSPRLPQNVSSPDIKRVNSYDVDIHVQKLKHNLQVYFAPLFIVFDNFESANSFSVEYRILAANIPNEDTGNLYIVIEKEQL